MKPYMFQEQTKTVVVFFFIFITRYCICSRMDRNILYKCLNNTCPHDYIIQTVQNILVVSNKSLIIST